MGTLAEFHFVCLLKNNFYGKFMIYKWHVTNTRDKHDQFTS